MLRALPRRLHRAAGARRPQSQLAAFEPPSYRPVRFEKEDVASVMAELPDYNFYEIKEPVPNPYQGSTLDRSILVDPPAPVLKPPSIGFSQLENGLKVVSVDKQGLMADVGLFVNSGSRYEEPGSFGASDMVAQVAFASTAHLSQLRTVKTLEQLGANQTTYCRAGREETVYATKVLREYVPLVVPLLVGNVLFPRLLPWEVKAASKKLKDRAPLPASEQLQELLHRAAYCNNSLGLPNRASERCLGYFTPETIRGHMLRHFAPERMALVGVNVDHQELAKWAMRSFVDYNAIPLTERNEAKAQYTGGDLRMEGNEPFCHFSLALESAPWGQDVAYALLRTVLGSGGSGLPGSGLTTRLGELQRKVPGVSSVAAFSSAYSDSGLFGVYGVCEPSSAKAMALAACAELKALASGISGEELAKAKAMLKAQLLRQTEDGATLLADIGSQVLLTGGYASPSELATAIDAVAEGELQAAATRLLSSRPSVAAYGDTHAVPHYSALEEALR